MPNPNPKPPKRKKRSSISKYARGGNKRRTKYDYDAAREQIGQPNANNQTIYARAIQSGPNAPSEKSPLKKEYKSMLKQKEEEVNDLLGEKKKMAEENAELRQNLNTKDSKIAAQKVTIQTLSQSLQQEKKKSRSTISKLMDEADMVMAEAHGVQSESEKKAAAVNVMIDRTKERHKEILHQERQQYSKQLSTGKFN